ncbi:MAG: MFS transporter [Pseudomonadota bacterium]
MSESVYTGGERRAVKRLPPLVVFFCVFLPFAFGHFLSCMLRNANAVLAPYMQGRMALDAGEFGVLTSAFFLAFALVQLPVGIALDRYGPRMVQLVLMVVAGVGALVFAWAENFPTLVAGRALIGLGLGGCFMSAVKAISAWIAPHKLPSLQGYLIAVGGLGAAAATVPMRVLLEHTDWRGLFTTLGGLTACAGLVMWLVAPKAGPPRVGEPPTLKSVLAVYRAPKFRQAISLILLPHMVFFGIQGLWIGRWLGDAARMDGADVAYLLYLSMAAVIVGAIGVGVLTERLAKRGIAPLDLAAVGVGLFMLVQLAIVFNFEPSFGLLAVLFTLVGTFTGMEYAIVAQCMPREHIGRSATCLNLLIFVGAFVVQAGFGQVIGLWTPDAALRYPPIAYQVGFSVLVLMQLPGLVLFVLRRAPVECDLRLNPPKEAYEIGPLRPSRQGETGLVR